MLFTMEDPCQSTGSKMEPAPEPGRRKYNATDIERAEAIKLANSDGYSYSINRTDLDRSIPLLKFYLVCSSKTRHKCPATKVVVFSGSEMQCYSHREHSDHPLPTVQRLPLPVKESIQRQAEFLTTSQIHHHLSREFPEVHIGTPRQIKYVKNSTLALPSGEDFAKIYETGSGFLQELSVFSEGKPNFCMMLWNQKSLVFFLLNN